MKNPDAKVVQFFYRELLPIIAPPDTTGVEMKGLYNNLSGTLTLPIYDLAKTYKTGDEVGFRQLNGKYVAFRSLKDDNTGNVPPENRLSTTSRDPDTEYWAFDPNACNNTVHQCYPLTTNEMFPTWIPDAEPPNDLYKGQDTQVDCDGIEIFDSPGFHNDLPDVEQRFTGITLEIIPAGPGGQPKATVLGAATWRISKIGNQLLQYWVPSLGGPADSNLVDSLHKVLVEYGFNPDF